MKVNVHYLLCGDVEASQILQISTNITSRKPFFKGKQTADGRCVVCPDGGGGYPGPLPWWPLPGGEGGTLVNFHDDHFWGGGGGYPGQLPWWPLLGGEGGYPGPLPWWPLPGGRGVPWSTSMTTSITTSGGVPWSTSVMTTSMMTTSGGGPMWPPIPQCSSCYLCSPDTKMMGLAWCTWLYSVAPKDCGKVTWDPPTQSWTDWQTNMSENITFPRSVKRPAENSRI